MKPHSQVCADLAALRAQLVARGNAHRALLHLSLGRPLRDLALDGALIMAAVALVHALSPWLAPLAVCLIGNRQRALGNILHDAGHRNLSRDPTLNDLLARALVAPLMFASLSGYRRSHFRHHLGLGQAGLDPDLLPRADRRPRHWLGSLGRQLYSRAAWWGSFAGHLADPALPTSSALYIVAWWAALLTVGVVAVGPALTATFIVLWLTARATVFHLITTFREMCDHFGLMPGGVFSFTRDMPCHSAWRHLIHPRNNGYHLTHHLLPAVPYYRLPEAHALFRDLPAYRLRGQVRDAYFVGDNAVTRDWQDAGRP